jgi:nucleoid DNA-binding protein
MAKAATRKKHLTKAELLASIATATNMPTKLVAAVLDALAAAIKENLSNKEVGVMFVPGLLKTTKKIPACLVQADVPKGQLLAEIAVATALSTQQAAAVLDALACEIKKALSNGVSVTRIIHGLVKRKTRDTACPDWLTSTKVTVVPELLPGADEGCIRGLHTYYQSPATNKHGHPVCGLCGADEIDWDRLHARDTTDVDYTVAQLQTDRFRYEWWTKDLDEVAVRRAFRKGPTGIIDAVQRRVLQSVGRVYRFKNGTVEPYNDGQQTTDKIGEMTVIHYGQHATGTCCRKCIEVWHGIPRGRELTEDEIDYLTELLLVYVRFKLPELGMEDRAT